jgi:Phospholipase_D-nuclease N-terminal
VGTGHCFSSEAIADGARLWPRSWRYLLAKWLAHDKGYDCLAPANMFPYRRIAADESAGQINANDDGRTIVLFQGGFTFANFLADVFAVFIFVLWLWLFISVASDLFRRKDVSGWGKVLWVILLIVLPYVGIFAYLLTQGRGMAERSEARSRQVQDDLRQIVGFSAADEIEKLERLKAAGSISEQEFARLRSRVVQ